MCLLVCVHFGNRLDCGVSKWEAYQSDFENRLIGESNQSVLGLLIRLSWHAVCPGIEWVLWLITFLGTNCNVLSCDGIAEALPHPMSRQWFGLCAVLEVKCRPTFGFDTGHLLFWGRWFANWTIVMYIHITIAHNLTIDENLWCSIQIRL